MVHVVVCELRRYSADIKSTSSCSSTVYHNKLKNVSVEEASIFILLFCLSFFSLSLFLLFVLPFENAIKIIN